ncbi:MAG: glycosyltransferase [Sutterella sp.]|nr:glycosyltransferase [Sutterella sp.]
MDLTNSFAVWNKGIVGLVRCELMLARELLRINNEIKFVKFDGKRFIEINKEDVIWLLDEGDMATQYEEYKINRDKNKSSEKLKWKYQKFYAKYFFPHKKRKQIKILNPFRDGDVIFSCGWMGTQKEQKLSEIKQSINNLRVIYLIYDLAMLHSDLKPYFKPFDEDFKQYVLWAGANCSDIVYCGNTAKLDTEEFFYENGIIPPTGWPLKMGNDIFSVSSELLNIEEVRSKYSLEKDYIMTVGSVFPKKNYKTLYQAYCILAQTKEKYPQLVICGDYFQNDNLVDFINNNPLIKDKIKIIQPNDEELRTLYKNSQFCVLPTFYEGFSAVLCEMLGYGKFCIASDIAPLKEVANDLVEYVEPTNPRQWAEKIIYYYNNKNELDNRNRYIEKNWKSVTWNESAAELNRILTNKVDVEIESDLTNADQFNQIIYYDISLLIYESRISGIPRTQFMLARYLNEKIKNIKFFINWNETFCEIPKQYLKHILSDEPIELAFEKDKRIILQLLPALSKKVQTNLPFRKNDIVFCTGGGLDNHLRVEIEKNKSIIGYKYIQLIYDFTVIKVPHTHLPTTISMFKGLFDYCAKNADLLLYGGKTAMHDGITYIANNFSNKEVPSDYLKFGSDFDESKIQVNFEIIKQKYGIDDNYVISVGTIEPRKNHEILYDAYINLIRNGIKVPQMLFIGKPGWKSDFLVHRINNDDRVKDIIKLITPSDSELITLYKNCRFTLLPSLYEGWSLTLPESLNFGKFCIASDCPPLKEIGEDLVEYANPYDPIEWAEKINYYATNKEVLKTKEKNIQNNWKPTTWEHCAETVITILKNKGIMK